MKTYAFAPIPVFFALFAITAGCGGAELDSPLTGPIVFGPKTGGLRIDPISTQLPELTSFVMENRKLFTSQRGMFGYNQRSVSAATPRDFVDLKSSPIFGFEWKRTAGNSEMGEYRLFFQGLPIRRAQVKEANLNGEPWAIGAMPSFLLDSTHLALVDFTPHELSQDAALLTAANITGWDAWRFHSGEAAFFAHPSRLEPVFVFKVSAEESEDGQPPLPVELVIHGVSGEILETSPLALNLNAQARLHFENKAISPTRSLVDLHNLVGTGEALTSDTFHIVNCQGIDPSISSAGCTQTATGTDTGDGTVYDYDYDDEEYDEVLGYFALDWAWQWNSFIREQPGLSAGRMDTWSASSTRSTLGIASNQKITVFTRSVAKTSGGTSTSQNAQCYPWGFRGDSAPVLVIGTGCETSACTGLRYLGKDSDVFMHEFHHHIVARTLTVFSGETLALHEGLADFLTYATTQNNIIGEGILDGGLRSGDMEGVISQYYNVSLGRVGEVHIIGQFLSSVLWDLRAQLGIFKVSSAPNGRSYVADKVIWDSIDLLTQAETFYGFIAALGKSAEAFAIANGMEPIALKRVVYSVFAARGFISEPDSAGTLPAPTVYITGGDSSTNTAAAYNPPISQASTSSSSKNKSWCGVIAGNHQHDNALRFASSLAFLLAMFAPLLVGAAEKAAKARARVRVPVRVHPPIRRHPGDNQ